MTYCKSDYRLTSAGLSSAGSKPSEGVARVHRPVVRPRCCLSRPRPREVAEPPEDAGSGVPFRGPLARYRLIGVAEVAAAAGALVGLAWAPLGVAAASGMALLLLGALTVHRRAGDSLWEAVPALVALGVSLAYLAAALTR